MSDRSKNASVTPGEPNPAEWLTVPDLVEILGEPVGRVHRLFDDHHLIGTRRFGALRVPAQFVQDGAPLKSLRGTATVLLDEGFTLDEVIDWLLTDTEALGHPPIESLIAGRKSEVRAAALMLG